MKLIRDKVPVEEHGRATTRLSRIYWLKSKLIEEAIEVRDSTNSMILEELADVYEVLVSLAHEAGYDLDDVQIAASDKAEAKGGFTLWRLWNGHK